MLFMNKKIMQRAIELARKGRGKTRPNPCVGAVIVKDDQIVAEGWHKKAGEDHAEIIAIDKVMDNSGILTMDLDPNLFQNAELYVTLEPCSHEGKTGPCVEKIVEAGFKRVYVGMKDPFEKVNGKGIKYLKSNGIAVEVVKYDSDIGHEVRKLNQPFIKWAHTGLPYVTMKAGVTLDGKVATASGDSKWITSEMARKDGRLERSYCDAVLVGSGTVMADDPELAAHGKLHYKSLLRIVLDSKLTTDPRARVYRDEEVLVACSDAASAKNRKAFEKAGVKFQSFGENEVDLKKLLKFLGECEIQSLFVEGGSQVHGAFFDAYLKDAKMLDQVLFYMAPKIMGASDGLSVVGGAGIEKIAKMPEFAEFEVEVLEKDLKMRGLYNLY